MKFDGEDYVIVSGGIAIISICVYWMFEMVKYNPVIM
jgi:hypothetical protein